MVSVQVVVSIASTGGDGMGSIQSTNFLNGSGITRLRRQWRGNAVRSERCGRSTPAASGWSAGGGASPAARLRPSSSCTRDSAAWRCGGTFPRCFTGGRDCRCSHTPAPDTDNSDPADAPARHRLHARRRARGPGRGAGRGRHRGSRARRAQRRRVHRDRARRRARGRRGAAHPGAGAARAARVLRGRERRQHPRRRRRLPRRRTAQSGSPATTATRWTRRSSAGTTPGC